MDETDLDLDADGLSLPREGTSLARKSVGTLLSGFEALLASRMASSKSKAKNYMQEVTEPYLKSYKWDNDTVERDMRAFWVNASKYYRTHTHFQYESLLKWAEKKNLHIRQVIKMFVSRCK